MTSSSRSETRSSPDWDSPAWRHVPDCAASLGEEVIELAASAGLILDPWQQDEVHGITSVRRDGRWAATSAGLLVPRQNGKGSIIEALELAWLFLCDVELIFHSAHLFATSADAYRRIKGLIENTPDLDRLVDKYSDAHGKEGIELVTGQRLKFVTRSKSGGRGFPAPVVVLDEFFNATSAMMSAQVPMMSAQANPFLLITSSHPIDDPCSDELRRFMLRSREGMLRRRYYSEYAADPNETDEERQLDQANPGRACGRLNPEVIDEERELLGEAGFRVERLGIVDLDRTAAAVIDFSAWSSCLDVSSTADDQAGLAFAVAVAPDDAVASVAVSDGRHVELTANAPGAGWLHDYLVERLGPEGTYAGCWLVIDPGSAAGALIDDLEAASVNVLTVTPREFAQACGWMFTAITEELYDANDEILAGDELLEARRLVHIGQPSLNDAVVRATKKPMGKAWLWSAPADVDITPIEAATLARYGAAQPRPEPDQPPFFAAWR